MHIIATAGHVDHGKSTLVRALTGTDPDRLEEEKRRGLTIDLGFAFLTLPSGREVSFIDVPGHTRFIANMLAGVGAIDAVMFVVSATEGWKPQSAEHLAILKLLGVSHGVVVLTHADATDEEGLEIAQLDVAEHVEGSFLEGAPVVATGLGDTGIATLRAVLDDLTAQLPSAVDKGRPRLWVDRSFVIAGAGQVVTGTLTGGEISTGDSLMLAPSGGTSSASGAVVAGGATGTSVDRTGKANAQVGVRAIQSQGREHDRIGPGRRVALNLTGADGQHSRQQLRRGVALCRPGQWHLTRQIDAQLTVLDSLTHSVSRRGAYALYVGSGEWHARLRVLPSKSDADQAGSGQLLPGETGNVRLYFNEALPLVAGDKFVLRDFGRSETVGGGVVLDVDPQLRAAEAKPSLNVERVIAERGWTDVDELERLTGERREPLLGNWVTTPAALEELLSQVAGLVTDAGPLGLDVASLDERQRLALEQLAAEQKALVEGGKARAAGAVDTLADHPVIAQLAAEPFSPSQPSEVSPQELNELARRGLIVNADGIWFASNAVELAAQHLARLLANKPEGVTMAEIRDALGTTRKFALPLVGLLDKTGITRRRGDLRIAGPRLP